MAMQLKDKNVQPEDLPGFVMVAGLLGRVGWGWRRFKRVFILKHKGNSKNIINAIKVAKNKKISSFALLGKGGGEAAQLADNFILVNSNTTARVQEMHIIIGHILCDLIEEGLGLR
jgi:hypothetical protein